MVINEVTAEIARMQPNPRSSWAAKLSPSQFTDQLSGSTLTFASLSIVALTHSGQAGVISDVTFIWILYEVVANRSQLIYLLANTISQYWLITDVSVSLYVVNIGRYENVLVLDTHTTAQKTMLKVIYSYWILGEISIHWCQQVYC